MKQPEPTFADALAMLRDEARWSMPTYLATVADALERDQAEDESCSESPSTRP